jgi:hypothetical protein
LHLGIVGVDTPEGGGNRFFFTLPAIPDKFSQDKEMG